MYYASEFTLANLSDATNLANAIARRSETVDHKNKARYSDRLADASQGAQYCPFQPTVNVTVFPDDGAADTLVQIFTKADIPHEIKQRNFPMQFDQWTPRSIHTLIEVPVTNSYVERCTMQGKTANAVIIAQAWHAASSVKRTGVVDYSSAKNRDLFASVFQEHLVSTRG
jgi:hypothetical protein